MNLHELSPAPGSKRASVRVVVSVPDLVKHLAKVKKDRNPAPAV